MIIHVRINILSTRSHVQMAVTVSVIARRIALGTRVSIICARDDEDDTENNDDVAGYII